MQGRVFAIGESVLDIIFRDRQPVEARPGGSMFNTSISLGRLGIEVYFIGDYGRDTVGNMVQDFLETNCVNTRYVERFSGKNTAIALAFLDEQMNASYQFYKDFPSIRMESTEIEFEENDIVLFGSFFALTPAVRPSLIRILTAATEAGAVVVYDPNFRRPHLHELEKLKPMIIENMNFADLVRGSDEDFELIFGAPNAETAYAEVSATGCANLVYTSGRNGVDLLSQTSKLHIELPSIVPVSTIGAGDSFNAGMIYSLLNHGVVGKDLEHIPAAVWEKVCQTGIDFASHVCMHYDNYISMEYADRIRNI